MLLVVTHAACFHWLADTIFPTTQELPDDKHSKLNEEGLNYCKRFELLQLSDEPVIFVIMHAACCHWLANEALLDTIYYTIQDLANKERVKEPQQDNVEDLN